MESFAVDASQIAVHGGKTKGLFYTIFLFESECTYHLFLVLQTSSNDNRFVANRLYNVVISFFIFHFFIQIRRCVLVLWCAIFGPAFRRNWMLNEKLIIKIIFSKWWKTYDDFDGTFDIFEFGKCQIKIVDNFSTYYTTKKSVS